MPHPIDPIRLRADAPVGADELWAWITEPDKVAAWFTSASALGSPGEPYVLDFGDGSVVEGEVRSVEPGRSFSHTWHWRGEPESSVTVVTWTVEPLSADRAALVLVHSGWAEAGLDEATRDDHTTYWRGYLGALVDLLAGEA